MSLADPVSLTIVTGLLMVVGLVGIVVPVVPGLLLTVGATLLWAYAHPAPGAWVVFWVAVVLYAAGVERDQPVPTQRVRRLATVRGDDEVEAVLSTMQETGAHLARVISAAGQVTSVVFLEDVLEELVGEVMDASQRS